MQEREATKVLPGNHFLSYFPDQSGPCLGPNPGQVQGMWLFHRQEGVVPGVHEDHSVAVLPHPVIMQVMMKCLLRSCVAFLVENPSMICLIQ